LGVGEGRQAEGERAADSVSTVIGFPQRKGAVSRAAQPPRARTKSSVVQRVMTPSHPCQNVGDPEREASSESICRPVTRRSPVPNPTMSSKLLSGELSLSMPKAPENARSLVSNPWQVIAEDVAVPDPLQPSPLIHGPRWANL